MLSPGKPSKVVSFADCENTGRQYKLIILARQYKIYFFITRIIFKYVPLQVSINKANL
jgi:hypothetical protein